MKNWKYVFLVYFLIHTNTIKRVYYINCTKYFARIIRVLLIADFVIKW